MAIDIDEELARCSEDEGPAQFEIADADSQVVAAAYATMIRARFSHVYPRLVHAKGCCLRAVTFALPEYDHERRDLNFREFQQTGFGVLAGTCSALS